MPLFRKKPIVVEAVQWIDHGEKGYKPHPGVEMVARRGVFALDYFVTTMHGDKIQIYHGDWILPEPMEGRFYPVKDEVFRATYEPAEG